MTIYLISKRGIAHEAVQKDDIRLTSEACNLDSVRDAEVYTDIEIALSVAKRRCKRCMKR